MRWIWPAGLAGRIAMVLVLSLVLVQLVTLPFFLRQQAEAATDIFQGSTVERIDHILDLFDPLSAEARRKMLPALSSPFLTIDTFYTMTSAERAATDDSDLARSLEARLGRQVVVKQVAEDSAGLPALLPTRQSIAIWVPLADGSWLRFTTRSSLPSLGWVAHMSAQFILVLLVLALLAMVVAQQITRPIRTFVAAAERLGADVNAPPIPERGSRELRRVTRVFNSMQGSLQRYVEDRTRMLAAISHDLRTSLTRLRLRTEFIEDEQQRSKAEQDLQHMDAMLKSTLAFARDDAASEKLVNVDLAGLLQTLCDDFTDLGEQVRYAGPSTCTVACRPVALQRAIGNVLSNAVTYGERALVRLIPGSDGAEIVIEDTGPGIPLQQQESVFEPFVRLEPSRNRRTGGTGLGLAIARSVMRSHGGDVALANIPGGGLRVSLFIAYPGAVSPA